MKNLFELREKAIQLYYKYDAFIVPVLKLIVAFIVLHTLNSRMGYFAKIDNVAIELIASLLCSFLPSGVILVFAGLFSLLHMYHLSMIVAALGVVVYLIVYLLFLRFAPKASLVVAITPVLMLWKLPYILPIILGLTATPGCAVAMGCGVIVYYFLKIINSNAATMANMGIAEAADQLKIILDELLANKGMIVVVIAFVVTMLVVYFLRRLPIKRNWEIAIGAGVIIDIIALLIGDVIMDTGISFINIILVSVLAVAIGFGIKFFKYCVDFGRTENVQFEDDDYYYYVKAVPKISIGESSQKVRRINRRNSFTANYSDEYYDDGLGDDAEYTENDGYYEEDGYYTEDGGEYYEDDLYTDEASDENREQ
ncbi:MAG: hypothetical protein K5669_10760 [Lachnospiraceae bacterium]|nr:hypothetical protein [Lachnospiraceae bacterium]